MILFKKPYNKSAPIKFYSPYTYEDKIKHYKKHNAKVRAKYYNLAHKYKNKHKLHIVYTSPKNGNKYEKLENILMIRSEFNKKLKNLKLNNLYFFSNIELGENYDNPHLDIQLWINETDINQLKKLHNKIIATHKLVAYLCTFNEYNPVADIKVFHYTVKEYKKNLTDKVIYELAEARKDYRRKLKRNVRFFSHTRNEYSQKIYKLLYKNYGLTYQEVNYVLDNEILQIKEKNKLSLNLKIIRKLKIRHLVYIHNKYIKINKIKIFFINRLDMFNWCTWIYGYT